MLTTVSIVAISVVNVVNSKWAYDEAGNNASHWGDYYAECDYSRQSPIDLPDTSCSSGSPLELQWTSELSHYAIRNTGYSLLAMPFEIDHAGGADISGLEVLHHTNDTNIRLQNSFYRTYESGISKEYCFDSLHFHWGATNTAGSEHTVGGEGFPLEVHLVHYSCDYPTAGPAISDYATGKANIKYDDENILAVVGVIFEIGKPNQVLNKMLDDMIIDGIKAKSGTEDSKIEMYYADFDVKGLLPESREITAYLGSLTTPPCFETVRWHVLNERMTVSEEQMAKFRSLLATDTEGDHQHPNFRPVQPLNDRTIYQCQEQVEEDSLFTDIAEKAAYLLGDDVIDTDTETDTELDNDTDDETADNYVKMSETELMWRMLGIAFIVLFVIIFIVCTIVGIYLCKYWNQICNGKDDKLMAKRLHIHNIHNKQMSKLEVGHQSTTQLEEIGGADLGKM